MISQSRLGRAYRLFDRVVLAKLPASMQRAFIDHLLAAARYLFPTRAWPASPDRLLARRHLLRAPMRNLPDWARIDMEQLALDVDPLLAPERFLAQHPAAVLTPTHWTHAGAAYARLCELLRCQQFDTVLLVPWLIRGGADLGALHHARACHDAFGQRTLVIATELRDSPWASRLPDGVHFLAAGRELSALSDPNHEPESVLARLLIQLAPARIHVINSQLAWRTVAMFGNAIRQQSRIFASLYCDERDERGRRTGLAQTYLPTAARWLDAVISDNTASPVEWQHGLGIAPSLFHVVHFPSPSVRMPASIASSRDRLLWASRIEAQKRPQLLIELATALPEFHWDVYGAAPPGEMHHVAVLAKLDNVTLHGGYDHFHDIVRPDHLAFVHTSAWDGMPNVLLEAASAGLPIIAPDIGGIRDLIPAEHLIHPDDDVTRFAQTARALNDSTIRDAWTQAQRQRLSCFTWETFLESLRAIPDYARTH